MFGSFFKTPTGSAPRIILPVSSNRSRYLQVAMGFVLSTFVDADNHTIASNSTKHLGDQSSTSLVSSLILVAMAVVGGLVFLGYRGSYNHAFRQVAVLPQGERKTERTQEDQKEIKQTDLPAEIMLECKIDVVNAKPSISAISVFVSAAQTNLNPDASLVPINTNTL